MVDITRVLAAQSLRLRATVLAVAALAGCLIVAARGAAQELTILRYEPLADLTVDNSSDGAAGASPPLRISFSAFGTPFALTLTRNDALTRNLPPAVVGRVGAAATFYTGTLDGNAESWARITRTAGALSGAIWDGDELYAIEQFARLTAYVVTGPEVAPEQAVIYRWSDTLSAVTDALGAPVASGTSKDSQKVLAAAVLDDFAAEELKLAPAKQLDIGLLADSEFVQTHGANAEAQMLSIANVVDGIFFDQLGVRINVAELRTYAEPDAFSGSDPTALLQQLETFKFDTPELRGQGLVHLLTGRDLDERAGGATGTRLLGVANFGVLCDARLAVGLTQFTDLNTAAVVAAHEIGHNFGAPHDTETGSPCEATTDGFIMNPFFNGSRQFSQCSLQQMEAEVVAAACLSNLPANDLSVQALSAPAEVIATREFDVAFAVDYGGAADAIDPRLTMTLTNARFWSTSSSGLASCYDVSGGTVPNTAQTCTFSGLAAAGGRVEFEVTVFEPQAGASLDIEITSLNDYTPANNRYRFDFDVVPDARFVLASSAVPVAVKPGEVFDVEWVVTNAGPIAATEARAEFRLSHELDFISAHTPGGAPCQAGPPAFEQLWLCPVGTVAAGETVAVAVKLRSNPTSVPLPGSTSGSHVSLTMAAAEPIFDFQNEWQEHIVITPAIGDVHIVDVTAPASATVGSDVTITLRVGNRGPDEAPTVGTLLRTLLGDGLTFTSATSSRGTCRIERSGAIDCAFSAVASGETIEIAAQATVDMEVKDIDLVASAGLYGVFDPDLDNNLRLALVRAMAAPAPPPPPVTPAPNPPAQNPPPAASGSGGGGGGSVDLALLLLLVASAIVRWTARQAANLAAP